MPVVVNFSCPRCGYKVDAASGFGDSEDAIAGPGDLTVCLMCGAPMEWSDYGAPRWLTWQEFNDLEGHIRATIAKAVIAIVLLRPSHVVFQRNEARTHDLSV